MIYCVQSGWTALHTASIYGYLDIVKYLVENGADVNIKDNVSGYCHYCGISDQYELYQDS